MGARPQFGWLCLCGAGGDAWTSQGAAQAADCHECGDGWTPWSGAMLKLHD
jgi:hypothetical protein